MAFTMLCDRCRILVKTVTLREIRDMGKVDEILCSDCEEINDKLYEFAERKKNQATRQIDAYVANFKETVKKEVEKQIQHDTDRTQEE